jgi:DNA-directed RNA polymerase subunit N
MSSRKVIAKKVIEEDSSEGEQELDEEDNIEAYLEEKKKTGDIIFQKSFPKIPSSLVQSTESIVQKRQRQRQQSTFRNVPNEMVNYISNVVPIRCITCGTLLGTKETQYIQLIGSGVSPGDAMTDLGIERVCCRTTMLSPPKMVAAHGEHYLLQKSKEDGSEEKKGLQVLNKLKSFADQYRTLSSRKISGSSQTQLVYKTD